MNAVLSGSSLAGGLPRVAGLRGASAGVPFAIQATTSNPTYVPDVKGIASSQLQNQLKSRSPEGAEGSPVDPLPVLSGKKKKLAKSDIAEAGEAIAEQILRVLMA